MKVSFTSNSTNCCPNGSGGLNCTVGTCPSYPNYPYKGVAMEGYEYQNYQTGAQPFWPPLRFPGQYFDAETDLFENWNRYYEPSTGRYLQPEPMAQTPGFPRGEALVGRGTPFYSYAGNNPTRFTDPTGLFLLMDKCRNWAEALTIARDKAGCDGACGDSESRCQQAIKRCGGCDICSVLDPGAWPIARIASLQDDWAVTRGIENESGGAPYKVVFDSSLCEDPKNIQELAMTMLHEASHACASGPRLSDVPGPCSAESVAQECGQ